MILAFGAFNLSVLIPVFGRQTLLASSIPEHPQRGKVLSALLLKIVASLLSMTLCTGQLGFSNASHVIHVIGSQGVGMKSLESPTAMS
jgi:hypothetical protein